MRSLIIDASHGKIGVSLAMTSIELSHSQCPIQPSRFIEKEVPAPWQLISASEYQFLFFDSK